MRRNKFVIVVFAFLSLLVIIGLIAPMILIVLE
jgi:hypothetical protein